MPTERIRLASWQPQTRGNARRRSRLALALALSALAASVVPAAADGRRMTSCIGGYRSLSCVTVWQSGLHDSYPSPLWTPRMEREEARKTERDRHWVDRCKPTPRYDAYGVQRYVYAAHGCEFGRVD